MRIEFAEELSGAEALVLFTWRKEDGPTAGLIRFQESAQGSWLAETGISASFGGKAGAVRYVRAPRESSWDWIILAGLGERESFGPDELRQAADAAFRAASGIEVENVAVDAGFLEGLEVAEADSPARILEEVLVAGSLALYRYDALKSEKEPLAPGDVLVFGDRSVFSQAVESARAAAAGIRLARDLANAPANVATPAHLAEVAREIGDRHGFAVEVFEAESLLEMGMGAFAAVFKADPEQARFITVDTRPDSDEKPLVVVGKGVTFDTGGISLKPSANMVAMKGDMAGAAAVLGFLEALGADASFRRVVALIPCTDNMPGGDATRPGDVVTALGGKTVEIVNTDAEGRLLLIDALSYAGRFDPCAIVDLATLTGAMVVALGYRVAGLFSAHERLGETIRSAGQSVGERIWPMPLWDFFGEELKSEVADVKNVGPREGGAIHAAMFLKRFVPDGVPWAHLDIAGPAFVDKKVGLAGPGGTGFGVRTLIELVRRLSSDAQCDKLGPETKGA